MAGQPRKRAATAELQRRAIEELGPDATILEYAESWVAAGKTILALANELTAKLGVGEISRETVRRVIYAGHAEGEAEQRLARARARGASGLVDQAVALIDGANTESREELQKAKMQADVRQWLAGKWNRDEYGDQKGVQVNISLPNMHIGALRTREVVTARMLNPSSSSEADAQVIEIEEVSEPSA